MITLLEGETRQVMRGLPEKSVQCCVTSPPYFGLRDYGLPPAKWADGWEGELGQEPTMQGYIAHIVEVFAEVWRVLRDDGTLWLNLGDSFNAAGRVGHGTRVGYKQGTNRASKNGVDSNRPNAVCLKPKDLLGIPWRVAFALQEAGWYLRSDIIWHKPNPMPESVTDRPTKAHEYMFLLAKSERYLCDMTAIAEPSIHAGETRHSNGNDGMCGGYDGHRTRDGLRRVVMIKPTRNRRSVWTVSTKPYKGAHYATFPPDLVKPCVLAGTSARGCCPKCGSPWERLTIDGAPQLDHQRACGGDKNGEYFGNSTKDYARHKAQDASATKARILAGMVEKVLIAWRPTCQCDGRKWNSLGSSNGIPRRLTRLLGWKRRIERRMVLQKPVPCTVLDPFGGSGTTGMVSLELGRRAILIEQSPASVELARERCAVTPGLPLS